MMQAVDFYFCLHWRNEQDILKTVSNYSVKLHPSNLSDIPLWTIEVCLVLVKLNLLLHGVQL